MRTKRLIDDARQQVEPAQADEALLWVEGDDWPAGIIGLVAGRLSEEYGKPTLAVAVGEAEAVGSCRSIQGYDIAAALAAHGGLMRRHGGHPQAAGFAVLPERRKALRDALQTDAHRTLDGAALQPHLAIDCQVSAQRMGLDVLEDINVLAPFGASNPQPRFLSRGLKLSGTRTVGANHLRATFALDGGSVTGIGFPHGRTRPGSATRARARCGIFVAGEHVGRLYAAGVCAARLTGSRLRPRRPRLISKR